MSDPRDFALLPSTTLGGSLGALRGEQMRRLAGKSPTELAAEFEAMLLAQVIKAMRESVPSGGLLPRSQSHTVYDGLFDLEMARAIAQGGGLGLAKELGKAIETMAAGNDGSTRSQLTGVDQPHTNKKALQPPMSAPLNGPISSGFGYRRDPITGRRKFHYGLDIAARPGTPITAVAGGTVTFSGWRGQSGNTVVVAHEAGASSIYRHAKALLVEPGQKVAAGDLLASVGESGRTTGPHLHFELKIGGQPIDPTAFLERLASDEANRARGQNFNTRG